MSDVKEPEATSQGDDISKESETLLDAKVTEEAQPKGPEPIYKDTEGDGKTEKSEEPKKESTEKESADDDKKPEVDYDSLEAPENSLLTDADMERIVAQSKEQGLSKEAAQKQVELANDVLKNSQERLSQAHNELSSKWVQEVKADKEIGGEKFQESIRLANKAIAKFGTESFIQSLHETKFGNNPEVVRIFARIGKAMDSDKLILGGNHTQPEKTMEELFYPNNAEN